MHSAGAICPAWYLSISFAVWFLNSDIVYTAVVVYAIHTDLQIPSSVWM